MTEELKPCPFCGTPPRCWSASWINPPYQETYAVCSNPDCWMEGRNLPLETWNTRPIEDALTAEVAALREEGLRLREMLVEHKLRLEAEMYAHRWIPVGGQLPEQKAMVLVMVRGKEKPVPAVLSSRDTWRTWGAEYGFSSITHWMPLPEPPEEP